MKKLLGIYKLTSPSGKIYIGQSVNLSKRLNAHKNSCNKHTSVISKSIIKYGWENIEIEILWSSENIVDIKNILNDLEIKYIKEYNSLSPKGYNIIDGGNSRLFTDEGKKRLSESHKGKKPSELTRLKMSETLKKKIFSLETKLKLSIKAKNKIVSNETKEKMRLNAKNMWLKNRVKIIEAQSVRKFLTCPHCQKTMAPSNAKQWHFDNCKLKQL